MWGPVKKCIQLGMVWSSSSRLIRPLQFGGLCRWVCVVIDGDSRKSQSCHFTIYVPLPITTQWPCDHGFPGVLLYARLLCLTCSATPLSHWPRYLPVLRSSPRQRFISLFLRSSKRPSSNQCFVFPGHSSIGLDKLEFYFRSIICLRWVMAPHNLFVAEKSEGTLLIN